MTLHLAEGAESVRPWPTASRFPILPARHPDGRMLGSWEGAAGRALRRPRHRHRLPRASPSPGSGTLDGGGDRGDWWSWPKETRDGARRARTVFLTAART